MGLKDADNSSPSREYYNHLDAQEEARQRVEQTKWYIQLLIFLLSIVFGLLKVLFELSIELIRYIIQNRHNKLIQIGLSLITIIFLILIVMYNLDNKNEKVVEEQKKSATKTKITTLQKPILEQGGSKKLIDRNKFIQEILATIQNSQIKNEFIKAFTDIESKDINFQKNTFEQEHYQKYVRLLLEYFGSRIDNLGNNIKENNERIFNLEKERREYSDKINDMDSSNIPLRDKISQYEDEINEVKTRWNSYFLADEINKLTQQKLEVKSKIEENNNKINGYEQQPAILTENLFPKNIP